MKNLIFFLLIAALPLGAQGTASQMVVTTCCSPGPDNKQVVNPAAADRGKTVYIAECVTCHGAKARGTDQGVDLIRSLVVLRDRTSSELGPFLKKGHPMQSGRAVATLTAEQLVDLSHFLKQRVADTLNRGPGNPAPNVLTGDAKAGEAYFSGAGKCNACHDPNGNLKGIGVRYNPTEMQQRMLFPAPAAGRGGRGSTAPRVTITVTPRSGPAVTGYPDRIDDFNITLRDASGDFHSFKRTPDLKLERHDPYAAHAALLPVIRDKDIHDLVAFLETLK